MNDKLSSLFYQRLEQIYTKADIFMIEEGFSTKKRPVFFRVNLLKANPEQVELGLEKAKILFQKHPLLENGYFLDTAIESDLWELGLYKKGWIYLQSFSSQLPVQFMELKEGDTVLDLTAAPGGKTSQISEKVGASGKVIAVENNQIRYEKMLHNLEKLGCTNVETVKTDATHIWGKLENEGTQVDAILFDAPCSSEGKISFEKEKTYSGWDEKYFSFNYKRQKQIIEKNISCLKSGGILLYSTCTLAPEENEGLVHFLLCNFPELKLEEIDFKYELRRNGIKKFGKHIYKSEVEKCVRILPNPESEGFFMAKFRKT